MSLYLDAAQRQVAAEVDDAGASAPPPLLRSTQPPLPPRPAATPSPKAHRLSSLGPTPASRLAATEPRRRTEGRAQPSLAAAKSMKAPTPRTVLDDVLWGIAAAAAPPPTPPPPTPPPEPTTTLPPDAPHCVGALALALTSLQRSRPTDAAPRPATPDPAGEVAGDTAEEVRAPSSPRDAALPHTTPIPKTAVLPALGECLRQSRARAGAHRTSRLTVASAASGPSFGASFAGPATLGLATPGATPGLATPLPSAALSLSSQPPPLAGVALQRTLPPALMSPDGGLLPLLNARLSPPPGQSRGPSSDAESETMPPPGVADTAGVTVHHCRRCGQCTWRERDDVVPQPLPFAGTLATLAVREEREARRARLEAAQRAEHDRAAAAREQQRRREEEEQGRPTPFYRGPEAKELLASRDDLSSGQAVSVTSLAEVDPRAAARLRNARKLEQGFQRVRHDARKSEAALQRLSTVKSLARIQVAERQLCSLPEAKPGYAGDSESGQSTQGAPKGRRVVSAPTRRGRRARIKALGATSAHSSFSESGSSRGRVLALRPGSAPREASSSASDSEGTKAAKAVAAERRRLEGVVQKELQRIESDRHWTATSPAMQPCDLPPPRPTETGSEAELRSRSTSPAYSFHGSPPALIAAHGASAESAAASAAGCFPPSLGPEGDPASIEGDPQALPRLGITVEPGSLSFGGGQFAGGGISLDGGAVELPFAAKGAAGGDLSFGGGRRGQSAQRPTWGAGVADNTHIVPGKLYDFAGAAVESVSVVPQFLQQSDLSIASRHRDSSAPTATPDDAEVQEGSSPEEPPRTEQQGAHGASAAEGAGDSGLHLSGMHLSVASVECVGVGLALPRVTRTVPLDGTDAAAASVDLVNKSPLSAVAAAGENRRFVSVVESPMSVAPVAVGGVPFPDKPDTVLEGQPVPLGRSHSRSASPSLSHGGSFTQGRGLLRQSSSGPRTLQHERGPGTPSQHRPAGTHPPLELRIEESTESPRAVGAAVSPRSGSEGGWSPPMPAHTPAPSQVPAFKNVLAPRTDASPHADGYRRRAPPPLGTVPSCVGAARPRPYATQHPPDAERDAIEAEAREATAGQAAAQATPKAATPQVPSPLTTPTPTGRPAAHGSDSTATLESAPGASGASRPSGSATLSSAGRTSLTTSFRRGRSPSSLPALTAPIVSRGGVVLAPAVASPAKAALPPLPTATPDRRCPCGYRPGAHGGARASVTRGTSRSGSVSPQQRPSFRTPSPRRAKRPQSPGRTASPGSGTEGSPRSITAWLQAMGKSRTKGGPPPTSTAALVAGLRAAEWVAGAGL